MNAHAVVVERAYPRPIMAAFHAMWSIGGAFAALIGAATLGAGVPTGVTLTGTGLLCVVLSLVSGAVPDGAVRRARAGRGAAARAGPPPAAGARWSGCSACWRWP